MCKFSRTEAGKNLTMIRLVRGLTQQQLCDEYERISGHSISVPTVSMWEKGKRAMSMEQFCILAEALNCTLDTICYGADSSVDDKQIRLASEIAQLQDDEFEILYHAFTKWGGNRRALMMLVGLYMSVAETPRADISGMAIYVYEKEYGLGTLLEDSPEFDMDYLRKCWGKIATWQARKNNRLI